MPLTNMKMTPKEAGTMLCCESASDNTPEYPYGLCINLNTEALERLGIDTLPAVGSVVEITARAPSCSRSVPAMTESPRAMSICRSPTWTCSRAMSRARRSASTAPAACRPDGVPVPRRPAHRVRA